MSWIASFVVTLGTQQPEAPAEPPPLSPDTACFHELVDHRARAIERRRAEVLAAKAQQWAEATERTTACRLLGPSERSVCLSEIEQFAHAHGIIAETLPPRRIQVDTACGRRPGIEPGARIIERVAPETRADLDRGLQTLREQGPSGHIPSASLARMAELQETLRAPVPVGVGLDGPDARALGDTVNELWTLGRSLETNGHPEDARAGRVLVADGIVLYGLGVARLLGESSTRVGGSGRPMPTDARAVRHTLHQVALLHLHTLQQAVESGTFDDTTRAALDGYDDAATVLDARQRAPTRLRAGLDDHGLEQVLTAWGWRSWRTAEEHLVDAVDHDLINDPVEARLAAVAALLRPGQRDSEATRAHATTLLDALLVDHPDDIRAVLVALQLYGETADGRARVEGILTRWTATRPDRAYAEAAARVLATTADEPPVVAAARAGLAGRLPGPS